MAGSVSPIPSSASEDADSAVDSCSPALAALVGVGTTTKGVGGKGAVAAMVGSAGAGLQAASVARQQTITRQKRFKSAQFDQSFTARPDHLSI